MVTKRKRTARRVKKTAIARLPPEPPQEFSVLMLIRDRDEQKRIADGMQKLYVDEYETTKALRAERDDARAALVLCLNAMTVKKVPIPNEARQYFRKWAVDALAGKIAKREDD